MSADLRAGHTGQPLRLDLPPAVTTALRGARRYLLDDGTPLYALAFDAARFQPQAFAAAAIACPDSIARSVRKRQAEFLFGRLAARLALGAALGPVQAQAEIAIGTAREPCWPAGSLGSISHGDGCAAAVALAAGQHQGIGIDLERLLAPPRATPCWAWRSMRQRRRCWPRPPMRSGRPMRC